MESSLSLSRWSPRQPLMSKSKPHRPKITKVGLSSHRASKSPSLRPHPSRNLPSWHRQPDVGVVSSQTYRSTPSQKSHLRQEMPLWHSRCMKTLSFWICKIEPMLRTTSLWMKCVQLSPLRTFLSLSTRCSLRLLLRRRDPIALTVEWQTLAQNSQQEDHASRERHRLDVIAPGSCKNL